MLDCQLSSILKISPSCWVSRHFVKIKIVTILQNLNFIQNSVFLTCFGISVFRFVVSVFRFAVSLLHCLVQPLKYESLFLGKFYRMPILNFA